MNWIFASVPEQREKGAAMMREHLVKYEDDAKAMTYLALYELKYGSREEARKLAQRAIAQKPDATTVDHAKKILDALDTPSGSDPSFAP